MTEIKMENRKSNVCQNGDLGAAGVCHKISDQVGGDGIFIGLGWLKDPRVKPKDTA